MDRYKCNLCGKTFRHYDTRMTSEMSSESDVVNLLIAYCPSCKSFDIGLTEHGKLLVERQKKIEHLNQINKN